MTDNLDDVLHVVRSESEAGPSCNGALHNRHVAGASDAAAGPDPPSGIASGRTRHTCSPGSPSTSRLVTKMVISGHQLNRRSARDAMDPRRCSQLSSTRIAGPRSQVLDEGLFDGEVLALLHVDGGGNRGNGRCGIAVPARVQPRRPRRRTHPTYRWLAAWQAGSCRLRQGPSA